MNTTKKQSFHSFIETISVRRGQLQKLAYHQARVDRTLAHFYPNVSANWTLKDQINIPEYVRQSSHDVFKCRVVYDLDIQAVTFSPYRIRPIRSLRLVHSDLDYRFKYADRAALTALFEQRQSSDDILIIKDGWITDSYYCNVAFWDGQHWWTPATPLLKGVQREYLMAQQIIQPRKIALENLPQYSHVKLFNAMIDWEDAISWEIRQQPPQKRFDFI